jgi:hypothetical protein
MSEWVPTRQHYDFVQQQINRVRHVRAEVIIKTALMYGGIWIAHALPGWMFWRWLFSDASMAWGVLFVVILATSMTVWWLMRLGIPGDDNLSVICAHCKESLYIPQSWFCGHCGGKNVVKRVGAFGIGAPVGPMLFDKCSFGSCGEKWQVGFECPKCAKHNVWSKQYEQSSKNPLQNRVARFVNTDPALRARLDEELTPKRPSAASILDDDIS